MLNGVTVTESGNDPATRFCGWLFAMNGATVTRIVPSGIDKGSDRWSEGFLNARKTVIGSENLTGSTWNDLLESDVVIADPDFDWNAVGSPTITGTVDAFSPDGPYANWRGNELVFTTLAGATGYTLSRDGTPVYGYGDRYQYLAGMYLYQSLCACLLQEAHDRDAAPSSPRVRVSNFESVVSMLPYLTTQYEYNQNESTAEQSGPRFVSACTDGYVVTYAGFAWLPIATALGRMDLVDDPRFVDNNARFGNVADLGEIIDAWASTMTVEEACRIGQKHNVAVTEVRSPSAALADEALERHGAWLDVPIDGGAGRIPAVPYTVDGLRPHMLDFEGAR